MFDSVFEKLQHDFKVKFGQAGKDAAQIFADSFATLPQRLRKSFDPDLLKSFKNSTKDLSNLFFKNLEYMKSALRLLKDQEDALTGLAGKISNEMGKIDIAKQAEELLHAKAYKGLSKTTMDVDQLLALDEMHAEKMEEMLKTQDALNNMLQQNANMLGNNLQKQQMMLGLIEQQGFLQYANNRLNQAFGVNLTNIGGFFKRFSSWKNIALELAIAVGMVFKELVAGFRELRKGGFDAAQSVSTLFSKVIEDQWHGARQGVLASTKEFAKNYAAMANSIGDIDVPEQAVVDATRLTSQFGLSAEEASGLTGEMLRMLNWSDKAVSSSQKMAQAMAKANGLGTATMMRDVAQNAELLGNYAGRGFDAFYKSVIAAKQFGVQLKTISGFADSLVDDFEGAITMQAKLQTINPSLDMSQVMYASQFGSDDQVFDALHSALAGAGYKNLGTLPRSIRNMITSSLNLSTNDLTNIMEGKHRQGEIKPGDENYSQTTDAFTNSITDLITGNKVLVSTLAALTGAVVANTIAYGLGSGGWLGKLFGMGGGGTGMLGGIGGKIGGALGSLSMSGILAGAGRIAGGVAIGAGLLDIAKTTMDGQKGTTESAFGRHKNMILGATLGSFIPGVGTAIGGGVGALGDLFMNWYEATHPNVEAQQANSPQTIPDSTVTTAMGNSVPVQIAKIHGDALSPADGSMIGDSKTESLLKQLIKAVKDGHIIQIDGREVGKSVTLAHRGLN